MLEVTARLLGGALTGAPEPAAVTSAPPRLERS